MTRQVRYQQTNKRYMNGVINVLQRKQGIDLNQAKQQFLKYYRPIKRNWGFEPNIEEFADKIINIDRIVKKARADENGGTVQWRKKTGVKASIQPQGQIDQSSELTHTPAVVRLKAKRAILVRR